MTSLRLFSIDFPPCPTRMTATTCISLVMVESRTTLVKSLSWAMRVTAPYSYSFQPWPPKRPLNPEYVFLYLTWVIYISVSELPTTCFVTRSIVIRAKQLSSIGQQVRDEAYVYLRPFPLYFSMPHHPAGTHLGLLTIGQRQLHMGQLVRPHAPKWCRNSFNPG